MPLLFEHELAAEPCLSFLVAETYPGAEWSPVPKDIQAHIEAAIGSRLRARVVYDDAAQRLLPLTVEAAVILSRLGLYHVSDRFDGQA